MGCIECSYEQFLIELNESINNGCLQYARAIVTFAKSTNLKGERFLLPKFEH